MPLIYTHELQPGPHPDSQQIYNGLDTCVTFEVFEVLQGLFNEEPQVYSFERALQGPAMEMMLRGFKIDEWERQKAIGELKAERARLDNILQQYAYAIWDKPLNPRSHSQLISFFYRAMHLQEHWTSKKGVKKLSMDRETLEKLEANFHAMPIIACILAIRDVSKRLEVLETEIDSDFRMRTSYNIAGTETGRWSSSASSTGTGTNLQNQTASLRKIFIADPGMKLCGIDLEQAESRELGWTIGVLFGDWSYYNACLGGDLHTTTAKLIWRGLPWTGDNRRDREIAERPFYRHFSYRDMSKRGGHGSNYYGTPFTMARHLKVPTSFMEDFQGGYFSAYPGIPKYHQWVAQQLQTTHRITTPFSRERHFFGRSNDDATLREAIAFGPQSSTADRLNLILWRVWKHMGHKVQILAQVHDALYFQFPDGMDEGELISEALGHFSIPISHGGRQLLVPGEAKVGWNWGEHHVHTPRCPPGCKRLNPDGLMKWKGKDDRKRGSLLDRVM